jgi:hypothetical protein
MVLPITNPTKSFWIEAAESPLKEHRTTPDLPTEADVVIIGSGYTGASAAYWLNKVSLSHRRQLRWSSHVSLRETSDRTLSFLRREICAVELPAAMVRIDDEQSYEPLTSRWSAPASLVLALHPLVGAIRAQGRDGLDRA